MATAVIDGLGRDHNRHSLRLLVMGLLLWEIRGCFLILWRGVKVFVWSERKITCEQIL